MLFPTRNQNFQAQYPSHPTPSETKHPIGFVQAEKNPYTAGLFNPDRIKLPRTHFCRLATPGTSIDGRPITCYSLLAFELDGLTVTDHIFLFDITRSKKAFSRLVRIARRENLPPTQLLYLVEDMINAELL